MADIIKFPGTEMEVFSKYPDSYRLDHPDFGDVSKTTYAKGIITDIQKDQDDPMKAKSLVKVEVEGQESDFLPLFYHPKAQYWDDTDVLATDFDEESGYFKRAWMSFRCGDEVVAMLKEGRPVAVLGFADGKPRVGEDIIKVGFPLLDPSGDHFFHLQCSKQIRYGGLDEVKTGLDGIDLGLTEEHSFVNYGGYYQHPPISGQPSTSGDNQDWIQCGLVEHTLGDPRYDPGTTNHWEAWHHIYNAKYHYHEFCVPVGPLLYIFQVYWEQLITGTAHSDNCPACAETPGHMEGGYAVMDGDPGCLGVVTQNETWNSVDIQCRAGVYSQKLLDSIAGNNVTATAVHDARAASQPWGTAYADTDLQSWDLGALQATMMAWNKSPNWAEAIFKVRSHNG